MSAFLQQERSLELLIEFSCGYGKRNPCMLLPGPRFLGLKTAAPAALGESPALELGSVTERVEGVKVGESTLNFLPKLTIHQLLAYHTRLATNRPGLVLH